MAAGTLIGGFRVEQLMRAGAEAVAYEATQLSLGRRVELVVHDDPAASVRADAGARRQALVHHPSIVPVFEVGDSPHGLFVARRLVAATTLAGGTLSRRAFEELRSAVEAAHAAGLVHGDLRPETVRVDGGRGYLVELRLPVDLEAETAADRRALARLEARVAGEPQARRGRALLAGAGLAVAAGAGAALLWPDGSPPAPPVTPQAVAIGSALAAGPVRTRDCRGRSPDANSPGCTLIALDASGRPVTVPADGVLRGWAVRGARGGVGVQVVRRAPDGAYAEVARTQVAVAAARPQRFGAEVPVRRGDLLGVELAPGAGIGTRPGGAAMRWIGPLEIIHAPRPPEGAPAGLGRLLVRFDVVPGARLREPPQLLGARAREAAAGEVLGSEQVEPAAGGSARVSIVRAEGEVVVDLHRRGRRLARMTVPDADPRGSLVALEQGFARADYVRLQWRNPRPGPPVVHGYAIAPRRVEMVH